VTDSLTDAATALAEEIGQRYFTLVHGQEQRV